MNFLAAPLGLQDLNSLTKDRTWAPAGKTLTMRELPASSVFLSGALGFLGSKGMPVPIFLSDTPASHTATPR